MSIGSRSRDTAAGLSLLGAGIIHFAAVGTHQEAPVAVASFAGIGLAQMLVGAGWLTAVPLRLMRIASAAVTVPVLLVWLVSRTVGLPAWSGHHVGPESVGLGDGMVVALQLAALALALLPARAISRTAARPLSHLAIVLVPAFLTVVGSFDTATDGHYDESADHHGVVAQQRAAVTVRKPILSTSIDVLPMPVTAPEQAPQPEAAEHGHDDSGAPHGH